jgi:hypothetical protein
MGTMGLVRVGVGRRLRANKMVSGKETPMAEASRKRKWRECVCYGCYKKAQGNTVHCIGHGGGRRCSTVGCDKSAQGNADHCVGHGGGRRCSTVECNKSAQGDTAHCKGHGGGRRCSTDGCDKSARDNTGHCIGHGGGRRCSTVRCDKSAQGNADHCVGHGGGRRCSTDGCDKSARDNTGHCIGHGGGRRCSTVGLDKSARDNTGHCVGHGGGRRCSTVGCDKSARGNTDHCKGHGGGNICVVCSDVSMHYKDGACYKCRYGTLLKQWESYTTKWLQKLERLQKLEWTWSYADQQLPCARQMSTRNKSCINRPDYVFVFETHVVILEVDESYHRHYAVECEVDRMGKIKDLVKLLLHLVRFNPARSRYDKLKDLLKILFSDVHGAKNDAGVLVHFVGYPKDRIRELKEEEELCYEVCERASS